MQFPMIERPCPVSRKWKWLVTIVKVQSLIKSTASLADPSLPLLRSWLWLATMLRKNDDDRVRLVLRLRSHISVLHCPKFDHHPGGVPALTSWPAYLKSRKWDSAWAVDPQVCHRNNSESATAFLRDPVQQLRTMKYPICLSCAPTKSNVRQSLEGVKLFKTRSRPR